MKVIHEKIKSISDVWGTQTPKETEYRLLKYTLSKKVDDGLILHNMVTGETVLLSEDEEKLLSTLPCEYSTDFDALIEQHFLVPVEYDEFKAVNNLRSILKTIKLSKYDGTITHYTILPTTACNARCFYCFEAGCETHTMSEQVAEDTAKFIIEHCGNHKVQIDWFGGEPTLGFKQIRKICNILKDNNVEYDSFMITNGYLFDNETVEEAKNDWHIGGVQITLDGTEEIYNKVKSYVGVVGSPYQRVIRNIGLLLDKKISVLVRFNIDKHNSEDLFKLVDELYSKFGKNEYLTVRSKVIFDDCGYAPIEHDNYDRVSLSDTHIELSKYVYKLWGMPYLNESYLSLRFNSCMGDSDSSAVIYPTGALAKCADQFYENLGNIYEGFTDKPGLSSWKEIFALEKCRNCPIYPNCLLLKKCKNGRNCNEFDIQKKMNEYYISLMAIYNKN